MDITDGESAFVVKFPSQQPISDREFTNIANAEDYPVTRGIMEDDNTQYEVVAIQVPHGGTIVYDGPNGRLQAIRSGLPMFEEIDDLLDPILDKAGLTQDNLAWFEASSIHLIHADDRHALDEMGSLEVPGFQGTVSEATDQELQVNQIRLSTDLDEGHIQPMTKTVGLREFTCGPWAENPRKFWTKFLLRHDEMNRVQEFYSSVEDRLTSIINGL